MSSKKSSGSSTKAGAMKNANSKKRMSSVSFASHVDVANFSSGSSIDWSALRPQDENPEVSDVVEPRKNFRERRLAAAKSVPLKAGSSDGSINFSDLRPRDENPEESVEAPPRVSRKERIRREKEAEAKSRAVTAGSSDGSINFSELRPRDENPEESVEAAPRVSRKERIRREKEAEAQARTVTETMKAPAAKKKTAMKPVVTTRLPAAKTPDDPNASVEARPRRTRPKLVPIPYDPEDVKAFIAIRTREKEDQRKAELEKAKLLEKQDQENVLPPPEVLRQVVQETNRMSLAIPPIDHTEPGMAVGPVHIDEPEEDVPLLLPATEPPPIAAAIQNLAAKPTRIPRAVGRGKRATASPPPSSTERKKRKLPQKSQSPQTASTDDDAEFAAAETPMETNADVLESGVYSRQIESTTTQPSVPHVQGSMSPSYPEPSGGEVEDGPSVPSAEVEERPAQTAFALLSRLTPTKGSAETEASSEGSAVSSEAVSEEDEPTLPFDADTVDSRTDETKQKLPESLNGESNEKEEVSEEEKSGDGAEESVDEESEESEDEDEEESDDQTETTAAPPTSNKSLYRAAQAFRSSQPQDATLDTSGPSHLQASAGVYSDETLNTLQPRKAVIRKRTAKKKHVKKDEDFIPLNYVKKLGEFFLQSRLSKDSAAALHKGMTKIINNYMDDLDMFCDEKRQDTITDWTQVYEFLRRQNVVEDYNEYCALIHRHLPSSGIKALIPRVVDGRCVPHYDPKIIEEIDATLNETRARGAQVDSEDDSD